MVRHRQYDHRLSADRARTRWRARSHRIPIVSEEITRALKARYYLALPWHFRQSSWPGAETLVAAPVIFRCQRSRLLAA